MSIRDDIRAMQAQDAEQLRAMRERAELRSAARERERVQALTLAQARHERLSRRTYGPLQAVVSHHAPQSEPYDDSPYCRGCDLGDYPEEYPGWPCSTIELIERGLGL